MTPKQKADIMAMNRDGLSIEEIAAATGINMTGVGVYLQKVEDIEEAQTKASHEEDKKTKGTTTMQLVKMKELRAQGMSCREIAEKLGMKESTVGYYLRKKEPAQAATCTDSEARNCPNISISDNTTKTAESQALEAAKKKLLEIYETLTPEECRAWELGEVYAEVVRGCGE